MSQEYLPLTTGSFSTQGGLSMCMLTESYKDICNLLKSKMALEEGSEPGDSIGTLPVVVVWDGIEYETTASYEYSANFGTSTYTIGNGSILDGNPKQGEPFVFRSGADYGWYLIVCTTQEGASHTFSISEKSEDSGGKINWAKLMQIYHLEGFEMAWLAYERMKGGSNSTSAKLLSSDGYTLQDVNENNLIPKEDE